MSHIEPITRYLEIVARAGEEARLPTPVLRGIDRAANKMIRQSGEMYRLHHDFETYCDVSVVDVGADVYSKHPSCEVLMAAFAYNDEPVDQWLPAEGQKEMPSDLKLALKDTNCVKFAWNKSFEWSIWNHVLGVFVPHDQWRDPMVLAFSLSLPGSLDKAGQIVELPEDQQKLKRGKALIRKFCAPRKPTKNDKSVRVYPADAPDDWEEFKLYNRTDVEAERAIYKRLKRFDMPQAEWDLWVIDQEINQRGIPINIRMVDNAVSIYEELVGDALDEMKLLTGLANPNSTQQLLPWLQDRGYPFDDLQKGHVQRGADRAAEQIREEGYTEEDEQMVLDSYRASLEAGVRHKFNREIDEICVVRRVLWLRLRAAKASPKKYYALQDFCDKSDPDAVVLRNAFQFAGAGRTWRWSGRAFQAQNLPRPATKFIEKNIALAADHVEHLPAPALSLLWDDPFDVLTSTIRPAAQAPEGYVFVDADLNAIENRVLGWIAKCEKILRVFELNRDPYIDFSTYLFGGSYDERYAEYKGGDGTKRTISKPGVLGCGYMLSAGEIRENKQTGEIEATGLLGYAWQMGIRQFTQEQAKLSVETFRREYEEVKQFWYAIEKAAIRCVRTGEPTQHHMIKFDMKAPFLRMVLPSGRALHYCRPRLEEKMTPWGSMKVNLTYEGLNDKKQWQRISTHGGKLTENADQAISRDLLAHGMRLAARKYKLPIVIHVHDQLVALAREEDGKERLEQLQACMQDQPKWAPGLPLGSAGFISKLFVKD